MLQRLSADDALRAFTLSAAEIFGVDDRLGSIETGKIANLIVADGALFDEGTTIETVFVDGERFKAAGASTTGEEADAGAADGPADAEGAAGSGELGGRQTARAGTPVPAAPPVPPTGRPAGPFVRPAAQGPNPATNMTAILGLTSTWSRLARMGKSAATLNPSSTSEMNGTSNSGPQNSTPTPGCSTKP